MIMTEKTETIQVYGDRKNTTRQKMYINTPKHTICYIKELRTTTLTLLQSEWPKLYGVLVVLSALGLNATIINRVPWIESYGAM